MRHWLQLATRSWRIKPARSLLAVLAVALGVGVVVWVTCCYESVRRSIDQTVLDWIGRSHVIVEPRAGVWDFFLEYCVLSIQTLPVGFLSVGNVFTGVHFEPQVDQVVIHHEYTQATSRVWNMRVTV